MIHVVCNLWKLHVHFSFVNSKLANSSSPSLIFLFFSSSLNREMVGLSINGQSNFDLRSTESCPLEQKENIQRSHGRWLCLSSEFFSGWQVIAARIWHSRGEDH